MPPWGMPGKRQGAYPSGRVGVDGTRPVAQRNERMRDRVHTLSRAHRPVEWPLSPPPKRTPMSLLILGLVIFLGVHSTRIVADAWRGATIARIGEKPWKAIYSLLSIAGFVLIVIGYGAARESPMVLYSP